MEYQKQAIITSALISAGVDAADAKKAVDNLSSRKIMMEANLRAVRHMLNEKQFEQKIEAMLHQGMRETFFDTPYIGCSDISYGRAIEETLSDERKIKYGYIATAVYNAYFYGKQSICTVDEYFFGELATIPRAKANDYRLFYNKIANSVLGLRDAGLI